MGGPFFIVCNRMGGGLRGRQSAPVPSVAARHLPALRGVTFCKGGKDFATDLAPV